MKVFALLVTLALVPGCVSDTVDRADVAVKERVEQLSEEVAEAQKRMDETLDKTLAESEKWREVADRYEKRAAEESLRWEAQSKAWRDLAEKQSTDWRADAELWRVTTETESRRWRETLQGEAENTRIFVAAQQEKATRDLEKLVRDLPGAIAAGAGIPTKTDSETGLSVIDWAGILGLLAAAGQYYRNYRNSKDGQYRYSEEEVGRLAVRAVKDAREAC